MRRKNRTNPVHIGSNEMAVNYENLIRHHVEVGGKTLQELYDAQEKHPEHDGYSVMMGRDDRYYSVQPRVYDLPRQITVVEATLADLGLNASGASLWDVLHVVNIMGYHHLCPGELGLQITVQRRVEFFEKRFLVLCTEMPETHYFNRTVRFNMYKFDPDVSLNKRKIVRIRRQSLALTDGIGCDRVLFC